MTAFQKNNTTWLSKNWEADNADAEVKVLKLLQSQEQGSSSVSIENKALDSSYAWQRMHDTFTAMNPPQCVADSHQPWLSFLYDQVLEMAAFSKYAASGKAVDHRSALKWGRRGIAEFRSWSSELLATANRLDVQLPASMIAPE